MRLVIGNKRFSSWSMRPWLVLVASGLPFEEVLVPFHAPDFKSLVGPPGKVPVLRDGDLVIHESLAIAEYLAELVPALWPSDRADRARARAISHEMHAGFPNLRRECSMDLYRDAPSVRSAACEAEIERVHTIWGDALRRSGGPFLFGAAPTVADAMFAPVVSRFASYQVPGSEAYRAAVTGWSAYRQWVADAQAERDWPTDGH